MPSSPRTNSGASNNSGGFAGASGSASVPNGTGGGVSAGGRITNPVISVPRVNLPVINNEPSRASNGLNNRSGASGFVPQNGLSVEETIYGLNQQRAEAAGERAAREAREAAYNERAEAEYANRANEYAYGVARAAAAGGSGGGGGSSAPAPTPAAPPVDTRTQAQRDTAFYDSLTAAQASAKAGDPTPLRNFDNFFGISRPEAEYGQAFYAGSAPDARLNLANELNVSQEIKNKIILEIQGGSTDTVSNLSAWFSNGGPQSPGGIAQGSTREGQIALTNAMNVPQDMKNKIILEIQSGNGDSVSNLVNWFGQGNPPSGGASSLGSTTEGKIALANAMNVSQDTKNKIIAEIQSGNGDSVSNLANWFTAGNPPSAAALALSAPPPPPPPPVDPAPSMSNPDPAPVPNQEEIGSATSGEEKNISTMPVNPDATEGQKEENFEAEKVAAAQAQEEQEAEQALAVATAKRQSSREERLRKIMEMRKPYSSGGATSGTGADAMVAPAISPASQVPPPPLP